MLFGAGAAAVALLIPWLPDPASEQADRIDFVFWFVTAICIAIFALVAAVIVYSILHFRARPDDDEDGPPTHGNTGLEIVWTAVPAALVTAIAIVSAVALAKNEQLPSAETASAARAAQTSAVNGLCKPRSGNPLKPLVVCVTAQQFSWLFQYPAFGNASSATLRLPIHTTVQLQLQSKDPLVLGARVRPEAGRRARPVDEAGDHADAEWDLPGDLHRALRARPCRHALPGPGDVGGRLSQVGQEPGQRRQRRRRAVRRRERREAVRGQRLQRLPHVQAGELDRNDRARSR
jgi:heme/copper-type cytochrome/quinol oxidase subunit 2